VLIGTAGLSGCGPNVQPNYLRDSYATLSDCEADWGRPEHCEPTRNQSTTPGLGSTIYRGPTYPIGGRDNAIFESRQRAGLAPAAPTNRARTTTMTTRGGFGSSARSFSTGG
jgi:hypothetical protein